MNSLVPRAATRPRPAANGKTIPNPAISPTVRTALRCKSLRISAPAANIRSSRPS